MPTVNTTAVVTAGFTITFSDVTSDAGTRYQIWYSAGVLSVWKDGTLEYSNVVNAAVDTATPNMTRCLPLATHKKSRAPAGESQSRPSWAGMGRHQSKCRDSLFLCHFQMDRKIPTGAKPRWKAEKLPHFRDIEDYHELSPASSGTRADRASCRDSLFLCHFNQIQPFSCKRENRYVRVAGERPGSNYPVCCKIRELCRNSGRAAFPGRNETRDGPAWMAAILDRSGLRFCLRNGAFQRPKHHENNCFGSQGRSRELHLKGG